MVDRRAAPNAWSDPRLYVSLLAILLTAGIYFLNGINNKLQTIDATAQRIDRATATQAADIQSLKDRMTSIENRTTGNEKDIRDYSNNASKEFGKLNAAYDQRKGK